MQLISLSNLHRELLAGVVPADNTALHLTAVPHRRLMRRLLDLSEALLYAREAAPGFDPDLLHRFLKLAETAARTAGAESWANLLKSAEELMGDLERGIPAPAQPSTHPPEQTLVQHVTDGDTFVVTGGWRVRLIGMDAPELHGADGGPEPLAVTARQTLASLTQHHPIHLVSDRVGLDRYGRLLRYAYVGDRCLNLEMVRLGLAVSFPVRPNLRFQLDFEHAEAEARQAQRGIWSA